MTRMTLRKTLGLLIASAALFVGLSAGVANAADSAGTVVRPDGTRVTAAPAAAPMTALDNEGAWVSGVGQCDINQNRDCWTTFGPNGVECPSGHFCIYTNDTAAEGGKVFSFYHCKNGGSDWALHNWTGNGYYHNSNVGGAHAFLKDAGHVNKLDIGPGASGPYNFFPIWFVQAC